MSLRAIEELTQQKHLLGLRVEELEVKVHNLSCSPKKAEVKDPNTNTDSDLIRIRVIATTYEFILN